MFNKVEIFEDALIIGGISISISMIHEILGIIILSFQVLLILYKGIRLIIQRLKNKDYNGAEKEIEQTIHDLEHLTDKDKDGK